MLSLLSLGEPKTDVNVCSSHTDGQKPVGGSSILVFYFNFTKIPYYEDSKVWGGVSYFLFYFSVKILLVTTLPSCVACVGYGFCRCVWVAIVWGVGFTVVHKIYDCSVICYCVGCHCVGWDLLLCVRFVIMCRVWDLPLCVSCHCVECRICYYVWVAINSLCELWDLLLYVRFAIVYRG